jgi:hypothetical protein
MSLTGPSRTIVIEPIKAPAQAPPPAAPEKAPRPVRT